LQACLRLILESAANINKVVEHDRRGRYCTQVPDFTKSPDLARVYDACQFAGRLQLVVALDIALRLFYRLTTTI
jgi:hypothetical protein